MGAGLRACRMFWKLSDETSKERRKKKSSGSFCSTCKGNVTLSGSGANSSISSSDERPEGHAAGSLLRHPNSQISPAVPPGCDAFWAFCRTRPSRPIQYQFVSLVCRVYPTDTPFGFCMLTSVDKKKNVYKIYFRQRYAIALYMVLQNINKNLFLVNKLCIVFYSAPQLSECSMLSRSLKPLSFKSFC